MSVFQIEKTILYEDKEIIVCRKSAGIAVQNARMSAMDMESALKNYLAKGSPGKIPYLGIVHRLDQPVEGVLVFAKTSRAANGLSRQMSAGEMGKEYLAVTGQEPPCKEGILEDYLLKDGRTNTSRVAEAHTPGAKKARLGWSLLDEIKSGEEPGRYLLRVILETGRHHQIRVQMAHAGMPLLGDRKYNPGDTSGFSLALCSNRLKFRHPVSGKAMEFSAAPEGAAFAGFPVLSRKE